MQLERCDCCDEIASVRAYEGDRLCFDCRFYHRHPEELAFVERGCCSASR